MIVIEGKNKKSKKIENMIMKEFRTSSVAILDTEGMTPFGYIDRMDFYLLDSFKSIEELIYFFKEKYEKDFKEYDWIVFNVNTKKDSIEQFKKLDREITNNLILTVKSSSSLTNVYNY